MIYYELEKNNTALFKAISILDKYVWIVKRPLLWLSLYYPFILHKNINLKHKLRRTKYESKAYIRKWYGI
ncbi:hypothetical protein U728_2570 [Clostridium botulinum 202F]|nr:hypothetical protein U728_2570 [Clostridium botulinum 202F]KON11551.1 hypothetical protein ACP50_17255 [Clostridium botulinum]NFG99876.1 hypothetical protein [Clostridium botulinum]NFP40219.1 hypothetical protein [Clostridium botulinum]NFQ56820.1 hypothetical protein [Clostridium botulinum]